MKKIYSILLGLLLTSNVFAQAPQKMSYQAVIRNGSGSLVASALVGMRISIIQGSIFGASTYIETQTVNTNVNGLASIEIGSGTVVTGTFAGINWATGPYFIKTETDPTGGTNYSITGTNQLMSVPYALFSANATPGPQGPQGPQGPTGAQGTPGSTAASFPTFILPEIVYQINAEWSSNISTVNVDFDTLIGQHVNVVILYYENICASGMSSSPVVCDVEANTNGTVYEIIGNYHAFYNMQSNYVYGGNSGQIFLPLGPDGIVNFSNNISRSNLKIKIIGYYP